MTDDARVRPILESRTQAHRAAEHVAKKPLSDPLEKLRRAQRALVRRKRGSRVRVSFSHSASSGPPIDKRLTFKNTPDQVAEKPLKPPVHGGWQDIEPPEKRPATRRGFVRCGRRPSSCQLDGHCFSVSPTKSRRHTRTPRRFDKPCSPVKVTRFPRYWGDLLVSPVRGSAKEESNSPLDRQDCTSPLRGGPGHTHNSQTRPGRQFVKKGRPAPQARSVRRAPGPRYYIMPSASYPRVPGCLTQVRLHLGDPVALESVRRSLSQQNRLSHLVPLPPESQASGSSVSHTQKIRLTSLAPTPEEDDNYSNRAPISSRSSSQRKALNRFTRELEKFAAVTNTQGRPPLFTPTLTVTPHSLNTIQELLPYREEFQAAGLAVTSAEQGSPRKATERDRSRSVIFFDGKVEAHEPEKCSSNSNESSNDTVIHFSEPTALTFALASEPPRKKKRKPKPAPKKILPWLRKKDSASTSSKQCLISTPPFCKEGKTSQIPGSVRDKPLPHRPSNSWREAGTQELHESPAPSLRARQPREEEGRPLPPPPQREALLPPSIGVSDGPEPLTRPQPLAGVVRVDGGSKCLPNLPYALPFPRPAQSRSTSLEGKSPIQEGLTRIEEARKSILNKEDKSHHCDHRIPEQERSPDIEIGENSLKPRSPCPELPDTWKYAVTTPSSFEKALDEVVRKLEDMGECRRTSLDPAKEKSAGRRLSGRATPVERLQKASELRRQKLQGRSSGHQTPVPPFADKVSVMSREDPTVDHEDRDIDDRDVLKGLKIAISAACDEELDAWIRVKTGLRLRRFLADLKTFENLSEDNVLAAKGGQGARQSTAERRNRRAVSASTKK